MTTFRNDIIKLAQSCGIEFSEYVGITGKSFVITNGSQSLSNIEAFFHAAQKLERERCMSLCDKYNWGQAPAMIKEAIRNRSNHETK